MPKFAALLQFLLALGGCAMGGTTFTHRISQDGDDVLASEAPEALAPLTAAQHAAIAKAAPRGRGKVLDTLL